MLRFSGIIPSRRGGYCRRRYDRDDERAQKVNFRSFYESKYVLTPNDSGGIDSADAIAGKQVVPIGTTGAQYAGKTRDIRSNSLTIIPMSLAELQVGGSPASHPR